MSEIKVAEMFGPTIQGEGPNVGARCLFVRVKGCSYKCTWCDSKFTWNDHDCDITVYSPEELTYYLEGLCKIENCNRVVLTGGNPCMYDFGPVVRSLKHISFDVETQGDLLPEWLEVLDTVVFSPKPPSSGMPDTYNNILKYILDHRDTKQTVAIKIPVFDDTDIQFAKKYASFVNNFSTVSSALTVRMYLSVGNSDVNTTKSIRDRVLSDYEHLLCVINENNREFENIFILPQLHTLVWGNKQGV